MYQIENSGQVLRAKAANALHWRAWRLVDRNILFLGLTSLFTDISSEMVAAVLPLYIMFGLQLSPLHYGLVDGIYQGATVVVRLLGGILADRWRLYKPICLVGYALSSLCRIALLLVGASWSAIAALVMIDRTGKSIRTPARDALIALNSQKETLATGFGVHRALDTAGAMIGPLFAFLLLSALPGAFDAIFVIGFCFSILGLGILILFVEDRRPGEKGVGEICRAHHQGGHPSIRCPNCRQTVPVLPGASFRKALGLLRTPRFAALVGIGGFLGLTTVSDGFIFLNLQQRLDLSFGFFPLYYVTTSFIYMLLAIPAGRIADRLGRGRVFLSGYGFLLVCYLILMLPDIPPPLLFGTLGLLGAYYATTDGVLMALISAEVPSSMQASGLALLGTAVGLGRLCSSLIFGTVWAWVGSQAALVGFSAGLLVTILLAALTLRLLPRQPS